MTTWIGLVILSAALAADAESRITVELTATLPAESLKVGESYEVVVEYSGEDGVEFGGEALPAPILQIKAPSSVELVGEVLTDHKALARNEFLHAPFERSLASSPARIEFRLTKEPGETEEFSLNFIAYATLGQSDPARTVFVRRRIVLPVRAGASSVAADAKQSDWGQSEFLGIGDKADTFELPRADGTKLDLKEKLGKDYILLTTYRAHW